MVEVRPISVEDFRAHQEDFICANFVQTAQMFQMQDNLDHFADYEQIGLYSGDKLIGQSNIFYRTRHKFFREALLLHGPLLNYDNEEQVVESFIAIRDYVKTRKAATLRMFPYVLDAVMSDELEYEKKDLKAGLKQKLIDAGFYFEFDEAQATACNAMFVKELKYYSNREELFNGYCPSLKRDIKKYTSMHVKAEDLGDDVETFYDILTKTAARKGFMVQHLDYFQNLKKSFGDDAKFISSYLDVPAYKQYIAENIEKFETKIAELEAGQQSKKVRGQIADAKDQLRSYYKRRDQFEELGITEDKLRLSAYLCMCNSYEYVSFAGGNLDEYFNFGGSPSVYFEMINKALDSNVLRFNFYGTLEFDEVSKGKGNFMFKKQFGGHLLILMGEFRHTYSPFYKLVQKIKP